MMSPHYDRKSCQITANNLRHLKEHVIDNPYFQKLQVSCVPFLGPNSDRAITNPHMYFGISDEKGRCFQYKWDMPYSRIELGSLTRENIRSIPDFTNQIHVIEDTRLGKIYSIKSAHAAKETLEKCMSTHDDGIRGRQGLLYHVLITQLSHIMVMDINSPDALTEIDNFCQFLDHASKQRLSVSSYHAPMTTGTTNNYKKVKDEDGGQNISSNAFKVFSEAALKETQEPNYQPKNITPDKTNVFSQLRYNMIKTLAQVVLHHCLTDTQQKVKELNRDFIIGIANYAVESDINMFPPLEKFTKSLQPAKNTDFAITIQHFNSAILQNMKELSADIEKIDDEMGVISRFCNSLNNFELKKIEDIVNHEIKLPPLGSKENRKYVDKKLEIEKLQEKLKEEIDRYKSQKVIFQSAEKENGRQFNNNTLERAIAIALTPEATIIADKITTLFFNSEDTKDKQLSIIKANQELPKVAKRCQEILGKATDKHSKSDQTRLRKLNTVPVLGVFNKNKLEESHIEELNKLVRDVQHPRFKVNTRIPSEDIDKITQVNKNRFFHALTDVTGLLKQLSTTLHLDTVTKDNQVEFKKSLDDLISEDEVEKYSNSEDHQRSINTVKRSKEKFFEIIKARKNEATAKLFCTSEGNKLMVTLEGIFNQQVADRDFKSLKESIIEKTINNKQ